MVIWSENAKADLKHIYEYIVVDSKVYAKKVIDEIVVKSELLEEFRNMGKVVQEIQEENVREIQVYSYRLIYQLVDDNVEVLALVHSRKNFQAK